MTRGAQRPRLRGITKFRFSPKQHDHSPGNAKLRQAFWSALEQARPDVVAVNGWNNFGSLIAANCCLRRGIPMVVMSESSRQDEPRTWWKEAIKRRIVGLYSAALVGGQRHVEYLVELGMPRERVFTGYDVVDNDVFPREGGRDQKSEVGSQREIRACLRITSLPQRVSSRRRISPALIKAYAEYRRDRTSEIRSQTSVTAKLPGISCSWVMVRCGKLSIVSTLNSRPE